jgi:hypothetical protein
LRRRGERRHIGGMATYTVTPSETRRDGFDVQIVGDDGVLQTRLGFETKADAEAWIIEDARTSASDDPRGFRMRWRL